MITKGRIATAFNLNGLPIEKIRFVGDGWFVYHPNGMEYQQPRYKKTLVSEEGNKKTYLQQRRIVTLNMSFIDSEDMLEMAITEAKNRRV